MGEQPAGPRGSFGFFFARSVPLHAEGGHRYERDRHHRADQDPLAALGTLTHRPGLVPCVAPRLARIPLLLHGSVWFPPARCSATARGIRILSYRLAPRSASPPASAREIRLLRVVVNRLKPRICSSEALALYAHGNQLPGRRTRLALARRRYGEDAGCRRGSSEGMERGAPRLLTESGATTDRSQAADGARRSGGRWWRSGSFPSLAATSAP